MHFLHKCSCGAVIAQCRCVAYNNNKHVTTIDKGCSKCHEIKLLPKVNYNGTTKEWKIEDSTGNRISICQEEWKMINDIIHGHYHGED